MNSHWQTDLVAQGAHIEHDTVLHYGDLQSELNATAHGTVLCDLSHLALLELNGADTLNFLQGQVTNDVKLLGEHNVHLTGYCSPKGRLLAIFLAYAHQSSVYLQLPRPLKDAILKRLKMYVLRSKVNITVSDAITLGISGPNATKVLATIYSELPTVAFGKVTQDNLAIIKMPSHQFDRYMLISKPNQAASLWSSLKSGCQLVGKPCWDWLDIQAGIPEIVSTTQEQFVPQMANLDLLDGINFKKGCYTGQEIVARTHYLGSVKRRTYLAHIASAQVPAAGDKLVSQEQAEVGQVVRATLSPSGGIDMLVELRIEAQTSGTVLWSDYPLAFLNLPYSLNTGD
jgi:tRNA-modifying protein YgfZ